MKKLLFTAIFLGVFALTGCTTSKQETYYTLTQEEIDNSHPEKLPVNYKSLIRNFFATSLKDPDSAKFVFYKPVRAYSASTKTVFWMVQVDVNAKNSYGGYTGYKPFIFARKTDGGIMEITPLFSMTKVIVVDRFVQDK
ncbi:MULTISPECIES: hypothetical protein [unclassified Gilliamella]|uniref:hypothetical protein n=1 Tax=unclassified Gilliamella TaxID=2685620 RepID=UPI00226AAD4D|nr:MULTISPECIES: hypothetical protein [unclassified Gilliamella]MCX8602608.1 hypothetical protein [Gilliamella sp. B3722]MCX8607795.1 hypothetical protein [Gilliamella sp. B3771]MCX8611834.1 hypothetical protein [Gilliamella sp. B3891]MCX8614287.1 hypothetical protein [Gilliamella sp. B3773]MCX8614882.1 hypothetical protein [Gilliamella sp. B3770]